MILRTCRAIGIFMHILLGILLLILTGAIWNSGTRPVKVVKRWWLARITRLLHMDIEVTGTIPAPGNQGLLLVSNHVSWTDIPLIGSLTQLNFLSKAEVRRWPLIGRLAQSTGTLFIQRGSGDTSLIARQIADYLDAGRHVLFFPEGTTGSGKQPGRFHRKLFKVCEHTTTLVCPIAVHYQVDGYEDNPVAFIGDDEFTRHLWKLLAFPRIKVRIAIMPVRVLSPQTMDQQVTQMRADILNAINHFNADVAETVNTSILLPGASSRADLRDEAASY